METLIKGNSLADENHNQCPKLDVCVDCSDDCGPACLEHCPGNTCKTIFPG